MELCGKPPKENKLETSAQISLSVEEKEDGDRKTLLPSALAGRKKKTTKKKKKSKRRVQWNDDRGEKLVQVLEYFPSDSSDSDDEHIDSCICIIM